MRHQYALLGIGLLLAAVLYVWVLDRGFGAASTPAAAAAPALQPPAPVPTPVPVPAPAPAAVPRAALPVLDPSNLLQTASPDWVMGTLEGNADVLVLVFPHLSEQARAMNRLAAYVEKAGAPRDRVLTDAELGATIAHAGDVPETFYLGHDYRLETIARFYQQTQQQHLLLQPQEQRLLASLLDQGLLVQAEQLEPGQGTTKALITVSQLSPADRLLLKLPPHDKVLSAAILDHEISHGAFLTRPAYRAQSWRFWSNLLTEGERQKWRVLLKRMDYDLGNEELLVNETQALLMHTPDGRVFSPMHLLISPQELDTQRARFAAAGKAAAQ